MDGQLIAIFCLCDDLLKTLGHTEDRQRRMTDAEVMTTAVWAALQFGGNYERARAWLATFGYVPGMLSKSRFHRRLVAVQDLLAALFITLGQAFTRLNTQSVYALDSFPIAVCDNIRIPDCRIYRDKHHRGYTASKRRYFYGVKLFVLATADGKPVEAFLAPGATADVRALEVLHFAVPAGSTLYADSAFTLYAIEDELLEAEGITLMPMRKCNSTRPLPPCVAYLQARGRKIIETVGSSINRLMPKSIHAVTAKGFELKVMLFVLAYSITRVV